jgi:antitoxin MazE
MKKDLSENGKSNGSTNNVSKPSLPKKRISRAGWSESSKDIAKHGDDYLILGEFPNLEDKNIEW